jgi:hypothetical protein
MEETIMKKLWFYLSTALLLLGLLAACSTPAPTATLVPPVEEPSGGTAFKITGGGKEVAWTEDELKAMDTLDVDYTGKDGTTTTYTGVPMNALLELAGAGEGATLVLVASDGYTAEIALADVQSCDNCIVAFDPEGGLRSVLPDQSGKVQVKDLVEIQIKGTTD